MSSIVVWAPKLEIGLFISWLVGSFASWLVESREVKGNHDILSSLSLVWCLNITTDLLGAVII